MAETEYEIFDDPGLKAAVRRAWREEMAPAGLRERVITSIKPPATTAASSSRIHWRFRGPALGLAIAAMLLVVAGLGFHFWQTPSDARPNRVSALPASLAGLLVARHEECCAAKDHHMPGLSRDNFALIGQQLHEKLGFPVLAARLPGSWDFHGASVCPVGATSAGHLVFEQFDKQGGQEFVSVFSLPRRFIDNHGRAGDCSQQIDEKHPMAGFVTPVGFYCLVGSSAHGLLTLDQVRLLRDQLRPDVAQAEASQIARVTVATSR